MVEFKNFDRFAQDFVQERARETQKVIYLIILFLSREFYHLMPTLTRHTTSMGGKIHLLSKFFREKCPETSDHPISPPMHWGTWMYRPS